MVLQIVRFISTVKLSPGLYTSRTAAVVKEYLEQKGVKDWARRTPGVDDAGAESAEVMLVILHPLQFLLIDLPHRSSGHTGGSDPNAPFHFDVRVKNAQNNIITTKDNKGRVTNTWHAEIGKSPEDLKQLAEAWKKQQEEKQSPPGSPKKGEKK